MAADANATSDSPRDHLAALRREVATLLGQIDTSVKPRPTLIRPPHMSNPDPVDLRAGGQSSLSHTTNRPHAFAWVTSPARTPHLRRPLMADWEQEFVRRVTQALTAEHYGHGFRPERVDSAGENGGAWSSWTWEDPSLSISVQGKCPCGKDVSASADMPEEIANLLRAITEPEEADAR